MDSSAADQGERTAPAVGERAFLTSAPLLKRSRSLVLWALGSGLLYSSLVASKGQCPGGFSSDGGFLDAEGDPTAVRPQCVQLVLHPSPVIYLALALTVIIALTRAAAAVDVAAAMQTMKRGAIVTVGIAVMAMVIAVLWFQATPIPATDGTVIFPFPFGTGTMTVTPQESGYPG